MKKANRSYMSWWKETKHHWSLEREEREKRLESLFKEIPTENFQNLGRVLGIQVYKANRSSYNFDPKPSYTSHFIIFF